jgi:hypothetical protein
MLYYDMRVKLDSSKLLHNTRFLSNLTTKLEAKVIARTSVARTRRKSRCCVKTLKDLEYSQVKILGGGGGLPITLLCFLGNKRS